MAARAIMKIIAAAAWVTACGQESNVPSDAAQADQESAPSAAQSAPSQPAASQWGYPETHMVDVVDVHHGVEAPDPYRWLEQDVRESADVRDWVAAQNEITFSYLKQLPDRDRIERRMTELWNFEKFGAPFREGGRYFFFRNDGLQNQFVLYAQDSLDGDPRVVIDPNEWSDDGTVALGGVSPSPDGRYLAYGVQDGGSDWRVWRVRDLQTGEDLEDRLEWLKFTDVSWLPDGSGFFYGRYPEPADGAAMQGLNLNMQLYFHEIGTDQSTDRLIYEQPDEPEMTFGGAATDDGRWLVVTADKSTDFRNQVFVKDLAADGDFIALVDNLDAGYALIGSGGSTLYFMTTAEAPNRRIVGVDMEGDRAFFEIVPESENVAQSMSYIGGRFVVEYLEDVKSVLSIFGRDGTKLHEVALPGIGSVASVTGKADNAEAFFSFSSFNTPTAIYRLDVATGEATLHRAAETAFDPEDYLVSQVFYASSDGTRVPMFIAHRRDLNLSDGAPTLLYGYGGFDISLTPSFSVSRLAWMEMGGVFALANIRGGGEYGRAWHQAGTKLRKQNVFDDFIAAAEFLIDEGYTTPEQLGVQGGSNGGLLVGAVVNQRPELFGAALPAVGVMDMLRFHLFTAGRFWTDDYGSAENPDEFEALYAYSPYHNLEPKAYPPILVTTADRDDRVVPGHSFKYAARLQEVQQGDAPVIIRIETRAGHGSGKPTEMIIEEAADEWAFLKEHLGVELSEDYPQ